MPESLRGNNSDQNQIRHSFDQNITHGDNVNSPVNNYTTDETEIVHLGKSSQNECSLFIQTGKKAHKALWDSGACKCVLSLESYKAPKVKSLSNVAPSVIFEPSFRHRSNYANCHTYEDLVTLDEHTASSGSFHIVMTNNSNHMLKSPRTKP